MKICVFLLLLCMSAAACDSLAPVPPTLTPVRQLSAPTLAPSPTVAFVPPTNVPENMPDRGQSNPEAASLPFESELPPLVLSDDGGVKSVQIVLPDSTTLVGTIYENPPSNLEESNVELRLPAVMLVSVAETTWGSLPFSLRDSGLTVIEIAFEPTSSTGDFSLAMRAFSETASVNPGAMGVVGLGAGADFALLGCAVELLCDTAVIINPVSATTLANVMLDYGSRPLMTITTAGDTQLQETALLLQDAALGAFVANIVIGSPQNADFFSADGEAVGLIVEWFQVLQG